MNRGFNNNYGIAQGNRPTPNFGQNLPNNNVVDYRERANQSDRRYDDFYSASASGNSGLMGNGGGMNNNRGGGNWNGPPQQMGFNNQAATAQGGGAGALNGQMLSAIQQQNLINAIMNNQQQNNMGSQNQFQNMGQQNRLQKFNQGNNTQFKRGGGGASRGASRGGFGGGVRSGDKRNFVQSSGANKPGRKFQPASPAKKKATTEPIKNKEKAKEPEPKEPVPVVEEIDIPDDEVVISDALMESVEKLRQRTGDIERNVVDEDVEKLRVFSFNGKGYHCKTCDIYTAISFANHLTSKKHVMKVIDARTAKKYQETRDILEIDLTNDDWFEKSELAHSIILKQAKLDMQLRNAKKVKELVDYNKTPSNFYKFNMELRKSVIKKDEEVFITSLVESTVGVKDFTGGKFFGCEFVRAVTGFHCRLCSINIREAKGVLPHIDTKLHKNNYAAYLTKNPDYEKMQKVQNQDLHDIMSQHEDKSIVLAESRNAEGSQFLSLLDSELVRIPSVMDPELKKKAEKEKADAEKAKDDDSEEKGEGSKDDDADESNDVEAEGTEESVDADEAVEEDAEEPVEEDAEEPVEEVTEEPVEDDADKSKEETGGQEEKKDSAADEVADGDKSDPYAQIDVPKSSPKPTPKTTPKAKGTVNKSKVKKLVAKVKGK